MAESNSLPDLATAALLSQVGFIEAGILSNLPVCIVGLWVMGCLMYAAWKHAQGQPLRLGFFVGASIPCWLLSVTFPNSFWRLWRDTQDVSWLTQRMDAAISVAMGAALGVVWARLAATSLYPNMDIKFLRQDPPTRQALHLIGTLALAGSFFGWQSVTTISLLTGLISACLAIVAGLSGRPAIYPQWSVWVWAAMVIHVVMQCLWPQFYQPLDQMNPALRYTSAALLIILLVQLHTRWDLTKTTLPKN
jgi:hypothetical protein